ncbi:chorismate mutase [Candidatus Contubernalis alkaliaceticus]|uniref:chorismate mutase n=1 Tax=Candidatus Contubernalis alkaliaceticus TaxID=338645 RepID=UPI001F4BF9DD|nr:chorismate mutase [Candidatus Contubernalis alkalaceticus]UNC92484.1 chorismate mutase [Candidatus Contubernalis alkalaceticus]
MTLVNRLVRGIRGATFIEKNEVESIIRGTKELLVEMVERNNICTEDICSVLFTSTLDLNAAFPALAARKLGWKYVPMLCSVEIDVPDSLRQCVRVLMQVNTCLEQHQIKHVYLKEAKKLRDDL